MGTERASQYRPLDRGREDFLREKYGRLENEGAAGLFFSGMLGFELEEVRRDYARMRLPWRVEISQPAGVAHGGAMASLIDSVVVPAIASAYSEETSFVTVDFHVSFLAALVDEDAVAEGWVVQRGRSIIFCAAEVRGARSDRLIAQGTLTYKLFERRD